MKGCPFRSRGLRSRQPVGQLGSASVVWSPGRRSTGLLGAQLDGPPEALEICLLVKQEGLLQGSRGGAKGRGRQCERRTNRTAAECGVKSRAPLGGRHGTILRGVLCQGFSGSVVPSADLGEPQ